MVTGTSGITGNGHSPATWIGRRLRSHEPMTRIVVRRPAIQVASGRRNPAIQEGPQRDHSWNGITALVSKARSEHKITIGNVVVAAADGGVELWISRSIRKFLQCFVPDRAFAASSISSLLDTVTKHNSLDSRSYGIALCCRSGFSRECSISRPILSL